MGLAESVEIDSVRLVEERTAWGCQAAETIPTILVASVHLLSPFL